MLTIVQRGGATREKPPEVVRGYASRLPWAWDGLCFAVPFNDATRDSARDLVVNAAPSVVSGLAWTKDNRGNNTARLTATDYMDYPDNPAHNRPSSAITAYVRMRRAGTTDASGGIFGKRYDTNIPFLSWALYHNDFLADAVVGHLYVPAAGGYVEVGHGDNPYVLPTTQWASIFLRWQSGTAPRVDILGERGEVISTSTDGTTLTGTIGYVAGQPLVINRSDDSAQNSNADYSQAMLWSRSLTDTEMQALVADPYGWYSPRRATVATSSPYPLIFGGGEMKFGTGSGGLR